MADRQHHRDRACREGDTAGFPYWRYRPYFSVPDEVFPDAGELDGRDLGMDYLQDARHFAGLEEEVRAYFRPQPHVWDRLATRFDSLLDLPHKTSVHVRRGDFLGHGGLFVDLPLTYYEEAMARAPGPYLVFSDDIAWCRANLPGDCVFMEHNRNYEDLFLMAACDEHVMANSTFSWWGAFLGGGRAFLPAQWRRGYTSVEADLMTATTVLLDVPGPGESAA